VYKVHVLKGKVVPKMFNADYFERGLETGLSCYQNYRWMPELTVPMAMTLIDHLHIPRGAKILDFGCAKGYLVKALRLLYRDAWGLDVSSYAIHNCDPAVGDYCVIPRKKHRLPFPFDFCVAKDVLEHINEDELENQVRSIVAETIFAVIPLGENESYRAPVNDLDVTHVICKPEEWWIGLFNKCGRRVVDFNFRIEGIKDSYYDNHPNAHGFFTLQDM